MTSGKLLWFSVVIMCLLTLVVRVPASETRCYMGICAPVVNGVVQIPASALRNVSRADKLRARVYAARNGIRWRVVRDR